MNILLLNFIITLAIISLIMLVLGAFVIFKNPKNRLNQTFSAYLLATAFWSFFQLCMACSTTHDNALFYMRLEHVFSWLIPLFFFHFVVIFLKLKKIWSVRIAYILGIFFSLSSLTPYMDKNMTPRFFLPYFTTPSLLHDLAFTFFCFYFNYGFYLMIKEYRNATGIKRTQLKYFLWPTIAGLTGGLTNFLLTYDIYIPIISPFGNLLVGIYCFSTAYAIIKHRLIDIRIVISSAGIFVFLYSFILGIPFYVGYKTKSSLIPTTLMAVLATLGPIIFRFLQKKAEALLYIRQRRYQKVLIHLSDKMIKEHKLDKLLKMTVNTIKKSVGLNFAALYTKNKETNTYELSARNGLDDTAIPERLTANIPLIEYLKKAKAAVLFEELPHSIKDTLTFPLGVSFIITAAESNEPLGLLILGQKNNREPYYENDINTFTLLVHQCALAIENCLFFENRRRDQEQLFRAQKLASIGGIANGITHQFKNRLNVFSLNSDKMIMDIDKIIKSSNDQTYINELTKLKEKAESISSNVMSTNQMINSIFQHTRPSSDELAFEHFSVKETIESIKDLLKIKHNTSSLYLEEKIVSKTIYGIKGQLSEAIYNLLDNAYEAAAERYKKLFDAGQLDNYMPKLFIETTENETTYSIIVRDNGIGIADDKKDQMFQLFFTSKKASKSGTGIGMYLTKRMIEEHHNGKIDVSSQYMQGTEFTIELPKQG